MSVMSRVFEDPILMHIENGMPKLFTWKRRDYIIKDVIGKWRVDGRWWHDGQDREYWRFQLAGGQIADVYRKSPDAWCIERMWD